MSEENRNDTIGKMAYLSGNCSYESNTCDNTRFSLDTLMRVIKELPEMPTILTMPIQVIKNPHLPKNYIILSEDVGKALEQALKGRIIMAKREYKIWNTSAFLLGFLIGTLVGMAMFAVIFGHMLR
jgi:hypothetical protein